ncbi:hypothetical protein [Halorussus pelagicus]|uniref:hypothetical protein n=1 Tax=Halorussus pelagicus TaxID=2505977 RepID=UPI000FFBD6E4|nr:hypothetical protein [Halorussus pelagicus]
MSFTERISWRTVGLRAFVLAILAVGSFFRSAPAAIFLASLAYVVAQAVHLRSLSKRRAESFVTLVTSSGLVLRRGVLWALIALAVLYDLLIAQAVALALASVTLVYVGGLFTQAAREPSP